MGKKKFIDKKNATTYSLVYATRDEGDQADDTPDDVLKNNDVHEGQQHTHDIKRVLVPVGDLPRGTPNDENKDFMAGPPAWLTQNEPQGPPLDEEKRREILELGFPDDGYDYLKHLRESRPDGTVLISSTDGSNLASAGESERKADADVKFIDSRKHVVEKLDEEGKFDGGDFPLPEQHKHRTMRHHLRSNMLTEIEDLMAEMEDMEEEEVGDLQDDFLLLASEGQYEPATSRNQRKAKADSSKYVYNDEEIEEYRANRDISEARAMMDECFDKLIDEYDCLDIGDLEEEEDKTQGEMSLGQFDNLLEDYLSSNKGQPYIREEDDDEIILQKKKVSDEDSLEPSDVDLKTRTKQLALDCEDLPGNDKVELEDKFIPVKGEDWDCESILSLRSNFDNHPAKITAPNGKAKAFALNGSQIRLSKHGIPLDYGHRAIPEDIEEDKEQSDEESTLSSEQIYSTRNKKETPEEKKARKKAVKEAKREARIAKKETKNHFKNLKQKQALMQGQSRASVRPM